MENFTITPTANKKTWEAPEVICINKSEVQLNNGSGADFGPGSSHS